MKKRILQYECYIRAICGEKVFDKFVIYQVKFVGGIGQTGIVTSSWCASHEAVLKIQRQNKRSHALLLAPLHWSLDIQKPYHILHANPSLLLVVTITFA